MLSAQSVSLHVLGYPAFTLCSHCTCVFPDSCRGLGPPDLSYTIPMLSFHLQRILCLYLCLSHWFVSSLRSGKVIIFFLIFSSSHHIIYARVFSIQGPNSSEECFIQVDVCQNGLNLPTCPELDTKFQCVISYSEN